MEGGFTQENTDHRNPPNFPPVPPIQLLAQPAGRDAPGQEFKRAGVCGIEFRDGTQEPRKYGVCKGTKNWLFHCMSRMQGRSLGSSLPGWTSNCWALRCTNLKTSEQSPFKKEPRNHLNLNPASRSSTNGIPSYTPATPPSQGIEGIILQTTIANTAERGSQESFDLQWKQCFNF